MKSRSGTTKFISNSLGRIKDNWRRFAKFRYVIKRQKESIRLFCCHFILGPVFCRPPEHWCHLCAGWRDVVACQALSHHLISAFSTLLDSWLILSTSSTRLTWMKCTSGPMPQSSVLITLRRIVRQLEALMLSWYHHRYDKLWQMNVMMSTGSSGNDWGSSSPDRIIWHAILFGPWRSIVRGKRSFGVCLIP